MDWVDTTFVSVIGLIILTILIFHIFVDTSTKTPLPISKSLPPPPKTSLLPTKISTDQTDPVALRPPSQLVGGGLQPPDQEKELADVPTYTPCYTRSALARQAYHLDGGVSDNTGLEDFQEGFGLDDLSMFFKIIGELFELALHAIYVMFTFPDHIISFGLGFIELGIGVIHLFENFISQLIRIFKDGSTLFKDITRCGLTWSQNLRICFLWYILDLILYTLIAVVFWVPIYIIRFLTFGKVDLNKIYLAIFGVSDANRAHKMRDIDGNICKKDGIMEKVDKMLHKKTNLHFMHFPDKTLATCYGCDIVGDVLNLVYDSTFGLLAILREPIEDVWDAGKLFWHAFYLDEFF